MVFLHPYFYVICVLFNPMSYQRRYELHRQFEAHMQTFGVQLITVELAFQNQTFEVTNETNPNHIQLRAHDFLWYKENLINIAISRLPDDCEYIAWIDADLEFLNGKWVEDTMAALEQYNIVQLFEYANFLGPNSDILRIDTGFGWSYATDQPYYSKSYMPLKILSKDNRDNDVCEAQCDKSKVACDESSHVNTEIIVQPPFSTFNIYDSPDGSFGGSPASSPRRPSAQPSRPRQPAPVPKSPCCIIVSNEPKPRMLDNKQVNNFVYWHPGYAWAAKRSTLQSMNGLFDKAILGASDRLMAFAFIGRLDDGLHFNMSDEYKEEVYKWGKLVNRIIDKKVGYVNGTINHKWHGSRTDRQYVSRETIFHTAPTPYDPTSSLYYDENRLLHLTSVNRDYYTNSIREYFSNRNEDNLVKIGSLI